MKVFLLGFLAFVAFTAAGVAVESDEVMIPATVNGKPVRLAFDTGAGLGVALWEKAATQLGIGARFPEGVTAANPTHVIPGESEPLDIELCGKSFSKVRIPVVKLPLHLAREFEGIVGWPALKDNVFRFEFSKGAPEVLTGPPADHEGWVRFRIPGQFPALAFEVPGLGIVAVDTGAGNGLSLSRRAWEAWQAAHPEPAATLDDYYMLGSGTMIREVKLAEHYDVGGLLLQHVTLEESSPTNASDYGDAYFGTLGRAALRGMVMIVDGKAGFVYARMNEQAPSLQPYNRLGAVFTTEGESDVLVARVLKGGPADRAGIRDGDELLRVDDVDVTQWRHKAGIYPVRQFFQKPAGTSHALVLKRGAGTLTVAVVYEELLR